MKNNVRVPLLKVMRCQDGLMWYAKLVGEYVPYLGLSGGEYRSRAPSGYSNFIAQDNARVVHVFVSPDKLGEYPYKYAQVQRPAKKPQPVTGQVPTPTPWPAPPAPADPAAQGCKARCDMLGVCRDLPDCEDALGRARRTKSVQMATGRCPAPRWLKAAANIVRDIAAGLTRKNP